MALCRSLPTTFQRLSVVPCRLSSGMYRNDGSARKRIPSKRQSSSLRPLLGSRMPTFGFWKADAAPVGRQQPRTRVRVVAGKAALDQDPCTSDRADGRQHCCGRESRRENIHRRCLATPAFIHHFRFWLSLTMPLSLHRHLREDHQPHPRSKPRCSTDRRKENSNAPLTIRHQPVACIPLPPSSTCHRAREW